MQRSGPLPDGRQVACVHPREVAVVWAAIAQEESYAAALTGLTDGAVILDVGAHIGLSAIYFADRVPGARILAFEPAPATFACLRDNVDRHVAGGAAFQIALGSASGEQEFTYFPNVSALSTLYPDAADDRRNLAALIANRGIGKEQATVLWQQASVTERITVPVTTLTNVITDHELARVDLLKIDVERAEDEVLDGLSDEYWPRVRRVVAEVHDIDGRLDATARRLAKRGYGIRVHQEPGFSGGSVHIVVAARD